MKSWKYENIWMVFVWIFMVFIHFACYVDLAQVESSEFSIILSVMFMYILEYTFHSFNRLFMASTVTIMLVTSFCCWLTLGGTFCILVTFWECCQAWPKKFYFRVRVRVPISKPVTNIADSLSTFSITNTCHQHRWSSVIFDENWVNDWMYRG